MRCQNCGSELRGDAKFCGVCGASVAAQKDAGNTVVCPKCKNKVLKTSLFCGVCGTPLNNIETPDGDRFSQKHIEPKKSNDKKFIILIVLILAIVLVCAGVIVFMLSFYATDTEEEPFGAAEENTEAEEEYEPETYYFESAADEEEDYEPDENGDTLEDEYLFPSDREFITRSDLDNMTKDEVALVRNEIYARHGFVFTKEPFISYFADKEWYTPNEDFDESMLNDIEAANKDFIVSYEEEKGWR